MAEMWRTGHWETVSVFLFLFNLNDIEALTEVDQVQNSQVSRGREVVDQASMVKMKVEASL